MVKTRNAVPYSTLSLSLSLSLCLSACLYLIFATLPVSHMCVSHNVVLGLLQIMLIVNISCTRV